MGNSMRGFEDALLDIYTDQFCAPSKKWLDLDDEYLTVEQLENYKKKKLRARLLYQKKIDDAKIQRKRKPTKPLILKYNDKVRSTKKLFTTIANAIVGEGPIINYQVDFSAYKHFVEDLGNGFYIPFEVQETMGVGVDYSKVSVWKKRHIKWQAAAQVLWYYYPMHNLKTIQNEIKKMSHPLLKFLEIDCLTSIMDNGDTRGRGLSSVIKLVAPFQSVKRGRPRKDVNDIEKFNNSLTLIPGVYDEVLHQVNFQVLKIAVVTITKVLLSQQVKPKEIPKHPVFSMYKDFGGLFSAIAIEWWINETLIDI